MNKFLTHEEAMQTGFLSVYEKDGEWCFNHIEWGGVVPVCLPDRELAVSLKQEFTKQALILEQALWDRRKDVDASPAQDETNEGPEADQG